MKAKLTGVFLIIGILCVLVIFNFNKITAAFHSQTETQTDVPKELNIADVNSFLNGASWVDYAEVSSNIDMKAFESGKGVYVHLWASWCAPCLNEIPELITFAKKNKGQVHFILVSLDDSKEDLAKFLKSFPEMNDPMFSRIWDRDKKISKFFDADRLPMTVVLDTQNNKLRSIRSVIDWKNL